MKMSPILMVWLTDSHSNDYERCWSKDALHGQEAALWPGGMDISVSQAVFCVYQIHISSDGNGTENMI